MDMLTGSVVGLQSALDEFERLAHGFQLPGARKPLRSKTPKTSTPNPPPGRMSLQAQITGVIVGRLKAMRGQTVRLVVLRDVLNREFKLEPAGNNFYAAVQKLRNEGQVKTLGHRPDVMVQWVGK